MNNDSLDEIFSTGNNSNNDSPSMGYGMPPVEPKKPKIFKGSKAILIIAIILAIVGVFVIGFFAGNASYSGISKEQKVLDEAYNLAKKWYIEDITRDEFDKLLAAGMLSNLDKYTMLYYANAPAELKYGFTIEEDRYNERIITDISSGSTLSGKAFRGDKLMAVKVDSKDWVDVNHMESQHFQSIIKGSISMMIKVEREGETLELGPFYSLNTISDSLAYYLDTPYEGIGYVRLKSFDTNAKDSFMAAKFSFENSGNNIMILDLRNNPGGSTVELNAIARCFIPNPTDKDITSKIVLREGEESIDYATKYDYPGIFGLGATNNDYFGKTVKAKTGKDFKLVVVANDMSASASEALIGIIKHYMNPNEVVFMGESARTFGKGIAQADLPLKSDPSLVMHITIGKYYILGPNGSAEQDSYTNIHGVGYELIHEGIVRERKANIVEEDAIVKACLKAQELYQS